MNIEKILLDANTIAISGHVRPDGDCVGSCMGLYHFIKTYYPQKEVQVFLEEIPEKFNFLSEISCVQHQILEPQVYDVFFILDCSTVDRIGFSGEVYSLAKRKCCIDHHISSVGVGEDMYVVPTASSTSELVYHLLYENEESQDYELTKEIAEYLYLGIAHDTGVFQYSNVAPSTMRIGARLLETGIQASYIVEETYFSQTLVQNRILGKVFLESEMYLNNTCMAFGVSKEEMELYGAKPSDLDGIISQMRNTQGVDIAIFMYPLNDQVYKVSMRSNDKIDVSKIAVCFQGGGHKKAAGFSKSGTYKEILEQILDYVKLQLKDK